MGRNHTFLGRFSQEPGKKFQANLIMSIKLHHVMKNNKFIRPVVVPPNFPVNLIQSDSDLNLYNM